MHIYWDANQNNGLQGRRVKNYIFLVQLTFCSTFDFWSTIDHWLGFDPWIFLDLFYKNFIKGFIIIHHKWLLSWLCQVLISNKFYLTSSFTSMTCFSTLSDIVSSPKNSEFDPWIYTMQKCLFLTQNHFPMALKVMG